jgi:hypothetical protein
MLAVSNMLRIPAIIGLFLVLTLSGCGQGTVRQVIVDPALVAEQTTTTEQNVAPVSELIVVPDESSSESRPLPLLLPVDERSEREAYRPLHTVIL